MGLSWQTSRQEFFFLHGAEARNRGHTFRDNNRFSRPVPWDSWGDYKQTMPGQCPGGKWAGWHGTQSHTFDNIQQLEHLKWIENERAKADKRFDLESRSLRFISIPEGAEGSCPTKIHDGAYSILAAENVLSPIVIDCAHRSLAPKPIKGAGPRPFIIRLSYYAQKKELRALPKARTPSPFEAH